MSLTFTYTVTSAKDELGRQSFDLDWTDQYGRKRGQCFFAVLQQHIDNLRKQGHTVQARAINDDDASSQSKAAACPQTPQSSVGRQ